MALDRRRLALEGRQISIQLDLAATRSLAGTGITSVQAQALLYILQRGGTGAEASVTELHQVTGHAKATVSHLIKRLRQEGYVEAETCPQDNRRKRLVGTEKGKALQPLLEDTLRGAEDALYRGFSPGELDDLNHLQQKMLRNLSVYQMQIQREETNT